MVNLLTNSLSLVHTIPAYNLIGAYIIQLQEKLTYILYIITEFLNLILYICRDLITDITEKQAKMRIWKERTKSGIARGTFCLLLFLKFPTLLVFRVVFCCSIFINSTV